MPKRIQIRPSPSAALGGVLLASCATVWAQDASQSVTITGSRIKSLGTTSNSPIYSIGAEEIKSAQPVVVEEFFKSLPAAIPAIGAGTNNGTAGGATIDIRGLGSNRSLVLIDGRRIVPFNLFGSVDTNVIPVSLLQRVDLVTGGASAVYGADAITGVANFVLRKNFDGFEASSSYGSSAKGDAARRRTDFTFGANSDRGNVALSFGYTKTNPLRQDAREVGLRAISSTSGNPQGSGTTSPINVDGYGQIDPATGAFKSDVATYNFNPDNYYQTPLDRTQVTALGNYRVNEHAEAYALVLFTRADVGSQSAPSGTFFNDYSINLGNPLLPRPAKAAICAGEGLSAAECADPNRQVLLTLGRRFIELGPRLNTFKNTSFQTTLGVRGDLFGGWTYDAYGSSGKSDQTLQRTHWGSSSKVQQALLSNDGANCTNTSNGCVPLNLFGATGSITPAMLKFIDLDAVLLQSVKQQVYSGSATGDLGFKSPWTALPSSAAIGAEYRELTAGNRSDSASQIQGEVLGTGAPVPDRSGTFSLKEVFGEWVIPIANNQPLAHRLALETGYRNTTFKTDSSRSYNTFKYGGEWAPIKDFRLRAMRQRATRSPNINELFAPNVTGLSNLATDPCELALINPGQANTAGTLSNLCRLTGVPLARIGSLSTPSAGQINILSGGNPQLAPEIADTTTLGFVWEPSQLRGLTVALDYYKINVNGAVASASATDVLDDCYNAARNTSLAFNSACGQVGRNPNNGSFNGSSAPGVRLPVSNLGVIQTAGYELNANYRLPLKDLGLEAQLGRVDLSLTVSVLDRYDYQATPRSVNRNCVGYYSVACAILSDGGGPIHKTKFSQRATWALSNWVFSYNWRHLSKVIEEPGAPTFKDEFSSIKAYDYIDLGVVWNVNKSVRLNLSVNNAFDKKPPAVGNTIGATGANSGNTFPQVYDVIGRFYTLGASLKF